MVSSVARCWASPALPPLPKNISLPPPRIELTQAPTRPAKAPANAASVRRAVSWCSANSALKKSARSKLNLVVLLAVVNASATLDDFRLSDKRGSPASGVLSGKSDDPAWQQIRACAGLAANFSYEIRRSSAGRFCSMFPAMPVPAMQTPGEPRSQARFLTTLLLLWLAGTALRLTILAVPPVIPLIHDELKLNATQIGILTGLPSMLFAFAAVPGSLLIARLGVRTALVVGLGAHRDRRRVARRDARCGVALRHDHRHGRRRRHHAGDHAAGGARLVSAPHRLCHRRLHQRPADRRNPPGRVDAAAGAAAGRRKLAMGLRGLERAGRHHRGPGDGAGAAPRCRERIGTDDAAAGGRTGTVS